MTLKYDEGQHEGVRDGDGDGRDLQAELLGIAVHEAAHAGHGAVGDQPTMMLPNTPPTPCTPHTSSESSHSLCLRKSTAP